MGIVNFFISSFLIEVFPKPCVFFLSDLWLRLFFTFFFFPAYNCLNLSLNSFLLGLESYESYHTLSHCSQVPHSVCRRKMEGASPYISSVQVSRKYFLSMANCICQIRFVQIVWVNYSPLDFNINGLEMKDDKRGGDKAINTFYENKKRRRSSEQGLDPYTFRKWEEQRLPINFHLEFGCQYHSASRTWIT